MAKKKVSYIDRVWYSTESKQVVGDMAFTFCDKDDTRVPIKDAKDLQSNLSIHIDSEDAVEYGEVGDGRNTDFAIYERYVAFVETDDDDDDLSMATEIRETTKLVEVFVCSTEENASEIIEPHYGKDVKINYREEE